MGWLSSILGTDRGEMLKFAIFDNSEQDELALRSAYAIGHDGAAVHSTLTHADGFLEISLPNEETYAFSMQWDCGSMGTLTLQTCLLPQSDTPYLLSLELARHRCMFFFHEAGRLGTHRDSS